MQTKKNTKKRFGVKAKSKSKIENIVTGLELVLREFELAYYLSPGIKESFQRHLKYQFIGRIRPLTKKIAEYKKFSFNFENLFALNDNNS